MGGLGAGARVLQAGQAAPNDGGPGAESNSRTRASLENIPGFIS